MIGLPALAGPLRLPALPALGPRRRVLVVAVLAVFAAAGAGGWYFIAARQQAAAHAAELAGARARAVVAAQARGVSLSATAVAAVDAAARAAARSTRVAAASQVTDLFGPHSWYVPPPPPPPVYTPPSQPAAPPPPMAPPLPFGFLGRYTPSGDATVFFLTRGDRVYDVKVGDTVEGTYAVESDSGNQLIFNYLPLGQRQALSIGASP